MKYSIYMGYVNRRRESYAGPNQVWDSVVEEVEVVDAEGNQHNRPCSHDVVVVRGA